MVRPQADHLRPRQQSFLSRALLPLAQVSQSAAYRLAMCDDIGNAAYDKQGVAAALLERLLRVEETEPSFAR